MISSVDDELSNLLLSALPLVRRASVEGDRGTPGLMTRLALATSCDIQQIIDQALPVFGVRAYAAAAVQLMTPVFDRVTYSDCIDRLVFPFVDEGTCAVVMNDPWDDAQRQWLINRFDQVPRICWADAQVIRGALVAAESHVNAMRDRRAPLLDHRGPAAELNTQVGQVIVAITLDSIERTSSDVVRFVDAAIYDAWKSGASDVHFECSREGVRVMLRLDGVLVETAFLSQSGRAEEVVSRIKVLSQLDITERRVPQDGRFRVRLSARDVDFRVSVMPSLHGEDVVLRLLDKAHLRSETALAEDDSNAVSGISLAGLGFDESSLRHVRRLARRPNGMLLVTGPTGSGKTTTLYAAIQEINTGQEKIITIEDPVEYELPGILQIPVNEKKGLTFARGLRSILRHDPDKILVGEIRDAETAEIAVQAALTGHLVFTTVHANNVYDVVGRFLHMNVDLYSFMSALNGVVAQRLVRVTCAACARAVGEETLPALLQRELNAHEPDHSRWNLAEGVGCDQCRGTGFKGRTVVAQVLVIDDILRSMVVRRAPIDEIKRHGAQVGAVPLDQRALELVVAGLTTIDEVDRVISFN